MRFIYSPNYTPHRIAFGLTPLALRLPLKGGVIRFLSDFFNNPDKGGYEKVTPATGRGFLFFLAP